MNINNVKRPKKRMTTTYFSTLNIQSYGKYNLYPQNMYDLIQGSPTGASCMERYQKFIEGNGLNNTVFSEFICNRHGETVDDIYRLLARDVALYHGFALHVNYNIFCEIVEVTHVPFESCRLEEETEDGKVVYINIHPDWEGRKTRKGKVIRVTKENVKKIYTFNPNKSVIMSQIKASGGIDSYRGQILWFSMDGKWVYPKPIYDKVITPLSTDEGLDNVKYRNVRNNFLLAGMLVHKKGTGLGIDEDGTPINSDSSDSISHSLDIFQGDENACAIMDVTIEQDEDEPKFTSFEATNMDRKYEQTEDSVTKRIYVAFGQEVFYRIMNGSIGFSSDIMRDAFHFYSSYTSNERRAISRALRSIFYHWSFNPNVSDDYDIEPLVYETNEEKV